MRQAAHLTVGLTLVALGLTWGTHAAAQANMAHTHIGHVADRFNDTPAQRGLLATAVAEAAVAQQHANLAGQNPEDLENMKLHTRHVMHALDPELEEAGPGLGYGLKKAAAAAAQHIEMAGGAPAASAAVRIQAARIAGAAKGSLSVTEEIVVVAMQILAEDDAAAAAELVAKMAELSDRLVSGDGGDALGLEQAEAAVNILKRAEGIGG